MSNLTFNPLLNVVDANHFQLNNIYKVFQGNSYTFYLELEDADQQIGFTQNFSEQPRFPLYLRFLAPASSTLSVTINDLNATNVVTKVCSQPFSNDPSIWSFTLSASETAHMSGGDAIAVFTDGNTSVATTFIVRNVFSVTPSNRTSC